MKKTLLLLFVFTIFASGNIFAQKIISKGVLGGLNLADVYGKDIKDTSIRTGFSIGVFAKIGLSERFLIQPEIHYTSKGFASDEDEFILSGTDEYSVTHERRLSLNYLEIPILAVFKVNKYFHVFGGPYLDFFLNGEAQQTTDGFFVYDNGTEVTRTAIFEETANEVISDDIRSPGYGLTIGLEYRISQISFGTRYSLGLSQIPDAGNVSFNHSNIQFMIGYFLK